LIGDEIFQKLEEEHSDFDSGLKFVELLNMYARLTLSLDST